MLYLLYLLNFTVKLTTPWTKLTNFPTVQFDDPHLLNGHLFLASLTRPENTEKKFPSVVPWES
jgi:hypothetical protein